MADSQPELVAESVRGVPGARRRIAESVAASPAGYSPAVFDGPPEWDAAQRAANAPVIDRLREVEGIDAVRERAMAFPLVFGQWRRAVTDLEARNAAKLQVLVWSLRELGRERESETYALQEHLHRVWGINSFPVEGDYRGWCVRQTRNYRLLPKHWRYV